MDIGAVPAATDTSYALISGSLHFTRWSTPVASSASPLPTSAKSTPQAWIMRADTSVSFASHWSSWSFRPSIPPAALHHWVNATAASNSSWLRPGLAVLPGSDIVPTRIVESVTPNAVAPLELPGPHTFLSDPKSPLPPLAAVVLELPFELLLERLHAVASSATTMNGTNQRPTRIAASPQAWTRMTARYQAESSPIRSDSCGLPNPSGLEAAGIVTRSKPVFEHFHAPSGVSSSTTSAAGRSRAKPSLVPAHRLTHSGSDRAR